MDVAYVVLAAGIGRRMRLPFPKTMASVGAASLVELVLKTIRAASATDRVYLVVNPYSRDYVVAAALKAGLEPVVVENNRWWLENGYSLYLASRSVEEDVMVVVMSDHIVHPSIISSVAGEAVRSDSAVLVAGDREALYVDRMEATRILCDSKGFVKAIGKTVNPYNYVDVGVLAFRRMVVESPPLVLDMYAASISSLVQALAGQGLARVVDVSGSPWRDIDTPLDLYDLVAGSARPVLDSVLEELARRGVV